MKAVKIIYFTMSIAMIAACIVLAVVGAMEGFSAVYIIPPVIAAAVFAAMVIPKAENELKKLMRIIFASHAAVVAAVMQAVFVFKVNAGNAAVIVAISILLVAFMVWALSRMFKKLAAFSSSSGSLVE